MITAICWMTPSTFSLRVVSVLTEEGKVQVKDVIVPV